jgi:hypothetical protein
MTHYASLDMIKQKLRIEDSTIDDELNIYMDEVDALINRELRVKFGPRTEYDYPIVLPLTDTTNPPVTFDLRQIAADLVEGKFRFKTGNDDSLWKMAVESLANYMEKSFGWTEGHKFRRYPDITISPTNGVAGSTITMTGSNWKPRGKITVKIVDESGNGQLSETTPETVLTDDNGAFTGITFATSSTEDIGSYVILATDKINHAKRNFTVTS